MLRLRNAVTGLRAATSSTARRAFADRTAPTEFGEDHLDPERFFNLLQEKKMGFFCGVPDSLLKDFCGYVSDNAKSAGVEHTITANEGSAVAMAAGYHLATGKLPLVYMQNSGLGNAVNPLLSLADAGVYGTPMVMLIGWRGEPGKKDEPQHVIQGDKMAAMLSSMGIPFEVLPDYLDGATQVVDSLVNVARNRSCPVALLVKKNTFDSYKMKVPVTSDAPMTREDALRKCISQLGDWDAVVSTTGFASREVFELREQNGQGHERDFLTVGSMGHASAIALGIAVSKPSKNVVCFDGDGAMLMQMGNMATVGMSGCKNFKHVINNNLAHDSVGAQPTGVESVDIPACAQAMGYTWTAYAETEEEAEAKFAELMKHNDGPGLLEIRVRPGARKDLGRPTTTPIQNKDAFMEFLKA
jgi:phosphonopyruvate decarboxylase